MRTRLLAPALAVALLHGTGGAARAQVAIESSTFGGLRARAIGPAAMSGRIAAVDAVATEPLTIWVGSASGGVWKSNDGGTIFRPVFDPHTQSIGAVAVDPSNPKVVWVGTGESWTRNSVSIGDGVYRTSDGGDTWQHVGLRDSERIARIAVDPKNGQIVFVCATGHLWDAHPERGVYRTTDGGKSWERVLYVDENTGCSDLSLDPQDARMVYAGMWQFRRWPWFFRSGGAGSGLYRSTDGGKTWKQLRNGLPKGEKGRIAVAVAPSRPSVVYALVESKETALYRSDDLGESWQQVNAGWQVRGRPFYFALVVVDPTDFRRVYKPGFFLTTSTDGGKSFAPPGGGFTGPRVHGDHHALWVNPKNPQQLILGTDGGLYISEDRGGHWRFVRSLPVSQFYEISYDLEWPYNVYGGLQDNGSWMGPSRSPGGVQNRDWVNVGYGDGFHTFVDPNDPDFVYVEWQGGNLLRFRKSTREVRDIKPYPGKDEAKLRFNWNTPIHVSPTR
ncbi:MAG: glycosyl hydrolase, partial [Gemmatimonadetes bacterium]|nr:glycosyl hydrolase [Gemmatimonadota bacterium]